MAFEGGTPNQLQEDPTTGQDPQAVPDDGTLATKAWNFAVQNAKPTGNGLKAADPSDVLTYMYQHDPNFKLPEGYDLQGGRVIYTQGNWWDRNGWKVVLGAMGGIAAPAVVSAMTAASAAPAAAGAAESAVPGIAISSTPYAGAVANTAAGAAAAGSAGSSAASGSVLGKVLGGANKARGVADVLGSAAKSAQGQNNFDSQNNLNWEKLKLAAPGERAKQSLGAALTENYTPRQIHWNGPGSGLRGEIPTYSGGSQDALVKSQQDPILHQMLEDAKAGRVPPNYANEQNTGGSGLDKAMGYGSLISSLLAAVRR